MRRSAWFWSVRSSSGGRSWDTSPSSSRPVTSVRWPRIRCPGCASGSTGSARRCRGRARGTARAGPPRPPPPPRDPQTGERPADPAPERHWRDDPRMLRAYSWLTALWGVAFLLRVPVQGLLSQRNHVPLLGAAGLARGLPVTAAELLVTLWV